MTSAMRFSYLNQIRDCTPPSRNGLSHANLTRNADMAEKLFWTTLQTFKVDYPEFMTDRRYYPGLPHRFIRTINAVDSSTISLVANCMEWAKHRHQLRTSTAYGVEYADIPAIVCDCPQCEKRRPEGCLKNSRQGELRC